MHLVLAILGTALAVGSWAYWIRLMRAVEIAERRWMVTSAIGLSMALALGAFGLGGGLVVGLFAGTTLFLGVAYFGLFAVFNGAILAVFLVGGHSDQETANRRETERLEELVWPRPE